MNQSNGKTDFTPSVSIILPALNEEDNLKALVNEIIDYFNTKHIGCAVIVVNDGSTDKTGEIADKLSITYKNVSVIHHPENKGYGKSLKDGFQAGKHEYLFFTDADRQFKINSMDKFLPFMKEGEVDMAIGYRIDRKDSSLRKFLAWCFNRTISILFSFNYKDIDCAFKLFKKEALDSLEIKSDDFLINTEILAKAKLKGLKVVQIGVEHYPRLEGESTVSCQSILSTLKRIISLYQEIKRWGKTLLSQVKN